MKSLWITIMLIATLTVAVDYSSYAQTPEQLYQKGLMKEEGEGALQEAISLYTLIADNSDADLPLRAKALLHIGLCYERMGTQEAVQAYVESKEISLSAKEFALMEYFIRHEGEAIHRHDLLNEVWGYEAMPTTRTVDNFIMNLRKKLEEDPANPIHILGVRGIGYRFESLNE